MTLEELNALDRETAERELRRCCGSSRWAHIVAGCRPFATLEALARTADATWASLGPSDWLEAFAAHPRIGAGGAERDWSSREQAGVSDEARARFAALNRDYESRFGYIFIVCAAGKSGEEMQRILERRMLNNPDEELREAAGQQRQITRLRLEKLLPAHNS